MTTMNNAMNTVCKPEYIKMRCTIVNGESWDFLMDISSLDKAEIVPVINWLVNGKVDNRIYTPKVKAFLMDAINAGAEVLMRFCFDDGEYNHFYAMNLISEIRKVGLCCEECWVDEISVLNQMYSDYLDGYEDALDEIAENLYEFFADTAPFAFDMI